MSVAFCAFVGPSDGGHVSREPMRQGLCQIFAGARKKAGDHAGDIKKALRPGKRIPFCELHRFEQNLLFVHRQTNPNLLLFHDLASPVMFSEKFELREFVVSIPFYGSVLPFSENSHLVRSMPIGFRYLSELLFELGESRYNKLTIVLISMRCEEPNGFTNINWPRDSNLLKGGNVVPFVDERGYLLIPLGIGALIEMDSFPEIGIVFEVPNRGQAKRLHVSPREPYRGLLFTWFAKQHPVKFHYRQFREGDESALVRFEQA